MSLPKNGAVNRIQGSFKSSLIKISEVVMEFPSVTSFCPWYKNIIQFGNLRDKLVPVATICLDIIAHNIE